ncbi:MAG TPA: hypothetical protein VJM50_20630, partial [Pyrinomonadaceae bacterium]|nr:hypothetical protein [Pyrinomonadaceae bacterium]
MRVLSNFFFNGGLDLRQKSSQLILLAAITVLTLAPAVVAQNAAAALAALPEADVLIYVSPQRILNDAAPRVVPPAEITKMRAVFADMKKGAGIDPSTLEYLVIAVRFHKPASDLSFVAPDVMAVVSGDFSSESLLTLAQLQLQDKVRVEKHGAKSISLMTIDPIASMVQKNPILKPYTEVGAVPLSANSLAIGNVRYLKAALDAADGGTGRINPVAIQSLMRDPNVLIAAQGAPIAAIARSLGMYGLENTRRESSCTTDLGNFYAAVTMNATNFSLRGAMHADNPDTAKIIYNLLSSLMQQGINAVPDKQAQTILQSVKMSPRESEIVWEADIPEKVVADFFKPKPKTPATSTKPVSRPPARKKR